MIPETVIKEALQYAYEETEKFGLPTRLHLELSIQKGMEIANVLEADKGIVTVGVCLMDIKLGEAFSSKRLPEHVKMSLEAGLHFLDKFQLDKGTIDRITNAITAHHGAIPFSCIEAEIVANADCYRFMHPKGVIHYIGTLTKRDLSFAEIIDGAEAKLEEKRKILSLEYCKKDLTPYYEMFKELFAVARGA